MSVIATADIQELVDELGPTLVALISANRGRAVVQDWLAGTLSPTESESARLIAALALFRDVAGTEGADIARQWMIADNTQDYGMPCMAIRAGDFEAARRSARHMTEDTYS